jgi:signal transduction histidine kinase
VPTQDVSRTDHRTFDTRLSVLLAALAVASLVILVAPELQFVAVAPGFDTAINTAAALVAGVVATFAWYRYREHGRPEEALEAAAFATLLAGGLLFTLAPLLGFDEDLGAALDRPTQTPIYVWSIGRLIAGVALIAAAGAASRPDAPWIRPRGHRGYIAFAVVLCVAAFVAAAIVAVAAAGALPGLVTSEGLERLRIAPEVPGVLPGTTTLGLLLQLGLAILFGLASLSYARLYRRRGILRHAFISAGLLIAAFSQLHMAIYPGAYTSLVTTSDLLRLAFYATLFIGIQVQNRADTHELREANAELLRLREADAVRATLEERARLAREVHDGLAQDLWFAKLKVGRLAANDHLPPDAAQLVSEVATAVDVGLADAREAVAALRASSEDRRLDRMLDDYLRAFGAQSDLLVEFDAGDQPSTLSPRQQVEIMRIAQEALTNVRRHADATTVRVHAGADEDCYRLTIADNGRGFVPDDADGFGLGSMRERAAAIGGALRIESEPRNGTTIVLSLPLAPRLPA